MTRHPQVWIEHGDQSAEVDEGLAALVLVLWRLGFRTVESCQGGDPTESFGEVFIDPALIFFETEQHAQMFRRLVETTTSVRLIEPYGFEDSCEFPSADIPCALGALERCVEAISAGERRSAG